MSLSPTPASIRETFDAVGREIAEPRLAGLVRAIEANGWDQLVVLTVGDTENTGDLRSAVLAYREALREEADPKLLAGRLRWEAGVIDEGAERAAELEAEFAGKSAGRKARGDGDLAEQFEITRQGYERRVTELTTAAEIKRAQADHVERTGRFPSLQKVPA